MGSTTSTQAGADFLDATTGVVPSHNNKVCHDAVPTFGIFFHVPFALQPSTSVSTQSAVASTSDPQPTTAAAVTSNASSDAVSPSTAVSGGESAASAAIAAVPAVAGIEAAAALAAAAGAEVDDDGILITEQHKREARLVYFGSQLSRMSAHLTMGGALVAVDRAALANAKIALVINAAADVVPSAFRHEGVPYIALRVTDSASTELSAVFPTLCAALHACELAGRTAFVHCHQGVSRSGAIACAYIMYRWGLSADAAIAAARKCRGTVSPNAGFRVQLHQWGHWLRQWRGTESTDTHAWTEAPATQASAGAAPAPEGITPPSRCLDVGATLPPASTACACASMFAVVPLPVKLQVHTAPSQAQGTSAWLHVPALSSATCTLAAGELRCVHPSDAAHKTRDESLDAVTEADSARVNFTTQQAKFAVVSVRQGPLRELVPPTRRCLVADAVIVVQTSSDPAYTHESIPRLAIWVGSALPSAQADAAVEAAQAEVAAWAALIPALREEGWVSPAGVPVVRQGTPEGDAYAAHMPSSAPTSALQQAGGGTALSVSHRAALEASYAAQGAATARGAATSRGAAPPPMAEPLPRPPAAILSVLRSVSDAAASRAASSVAAGLVEAGDSAPDSAAAAGGDGSGPETLPGAAGDPPLAPRGGAHEVDEGEDGGNPSMSLGRPSLYRLTQVQALAGGGAKLQADAWERLGEYDHEDLEDGGVFALVGVGCSPPEEADSDADDDVDPFDMSLEQAAASPHCVWLWCGPGSEDARDVEHVHVVRSVLSAHYASRGVVSPPDSALSAATVRTQVHGQEEEAFWDWFVAGF